MSKLPPLDIIDDRRRVWHYNDPSRPADAVYIGRAMPRYRLPKSDWANNPLSAYVGYPPDERLEKYLEDFKNFIVPHRLWVWQELHKRDWLTPLIGHDLVCWCAKKGKPLTADDPLVCHGQVLLQLIRERG